MKPPRILRVLVVDASPTRRRLMCRAIAADAGLEVLAQAADAWAARDALVLQEPDVVVLDLELPGIDGLALLGRYMPTLPTPTVVLDAGRAADKARLAQALAAGAAGVAPRPCADDPTRRQRQLDLLLSRIKAAARGRPGAAPADPARTDDTTQRASERLIAVGSSTGGVEALHQLLPAFDEQTPGMVIVQHMPAGFTGSLARRLDGLGRLRVREASDGDRVLRGHALLAPGGTRHMVLVRAGAQFRVRLVEGAPVNYSRPSVDVLFESVAAQAGARAAAILLTGMGRDGAAGMLAIRRSGGHTVAQDEATSVVFGMPQMARRMGAAEAVAPLSSIPATLARLMASQRPAAARPPTNAGELHDAKPGI